MNVTNAITIDLPIPMETKLGKIDYTKKDLFNFTQGLCGFENYHKYIITFLPNEQSGSTYRYMQSLDKSDFGIVLLGINLQSKSMIDKNDLHEHLHRHNLNLEDVVVYLITSLRSENNRSVVSFNTKAPILLANNSQEGWQVILENSRREVLHYF